MRTHYYSGFFEKALPEKMVELLRSDIKDRKSIVMIWGWLPEEDLNFAKNVWFGPAGIVFDEYHFIDPQMPNEKAHALLLNASVILLLGGYTMLQNAFLAEYELAAPIKESNAAVIIGISAGAMNMATKLVSQTNGICSGLGLDNFCYEPYFSLDKDELIRDELLPLSQKLNVYATSNESFIRVKDSDVEAFGDVYLISDSDIHKIEES